MKTLSSILSVTGRISHKSTAFPDSFLALLLWLTLLPAFSAGETFSGEVHSLQPVIYGDIDGVSIISQGDMAIFYPALDKESAGRSEGQSGRNLFDIMANNDTKAILLNPEEIWFLYSEKSKPNELASLSDQSSPERFSSQSSFAVSLPIQIMPTATVTGIPVIDQTPAIAWLNRETMSILAELLQTHGTRSLPGITESEVEAERTSTVPYLAPTPYVQKEMWEEYEVNYDQDVYRLAPSPPLPCSVTVAHSVSWKIRQAGTTETSQSTGSLSSSEQMQTSGVTQQASPKSTPVLSAATLPKVEVGVEKEGKKGKKRKREKEETIYLILRTSYYGIGDLTDFAREELRKRYGAAIIPSLNTGWRRIKEEPEEHQLLAEYLKEYKDKKELEKILQPDQNWQDRTDWVSGIHIEEVPLRAYKIGLCDPDEDYEETQSMPTGWREHYGMILEKEAYEQKFKEFELFIPEFKSFVFSEEVEDGKKIALLQSLFPPPDSASSEVGLSLEGFITNFQILIGRDYREAKDHFEKQAFAWKPDKSEDNK